jgi:L-ascorbate metabolism protein UlaG (beta-lactamase superfamily)
MILGLLLTMDAEQGVEMLEIIQPQMAIPIHYNDYDVFKSPLGDFVEAARAAGWQDRIRILTHGETHTIK